MAIMQLFTFSVYSIYLKTCLSLTSLPEPPEYILSFPTSDNPLNIAVNKTHPEMNYILTIGDWGAQSATDIIVQKAVASKMIEYYNKQKAAQYNLLFLAVVGDNFYYAGAEKNCREYRKKWRDIYGELVEYPWLAVMGNHDWGNDDANAMCAWSGKTKYVESSTNIPYATNQINRDKKGCNPEMYYLPDFGYYYTIHDLNLEFIALEESVTDCPSGIGGGNDEDTFQICGNSTIGCKYLGKMRDASEQMMVNRSIVSKASNFLLIQHFPTEGMRLVDTFKQKRSNDNSNEKVWSVYGHTHVQQCDRYASDGLCDAILSGGGGGCCSENTLRGFYVIGFDENKSMTQPLAINDAELTCQYPCSNDMDDLDGKEILKSEYEQCCYTQNHDGFTQNCDLYKCEE